MFRVLYRNLQHSIRTRELPTIHLNVFGVKFISHLSESTNPPLLTVDYLINLCGLSPNRALSAAEKIRMCSTEQADSVLTFFQNYGLTKTQIKKLISKSPSVLFFDPDKILKPKVEFLHGLGLSGPKLAEFLVSKPTLLSMSLQNQIIPSFNFLKSFIGTNGNFLTALRQCTWVLHYNLEKVMTPNIAILRDHGVPERNMLKLLSHPRTLTQKTDRFRYIIEAVKRMGLDPSNPLFIDAVHTMARLSQSSWEGKWAVYRNLGWSEDEILSVFKRQPFVMLVSAKKIRSVVDFFVKKLKWKLADISVCPCVFMLNLKKRIIPRCRVLEILNSKGTIRTNMKVGSVLQLTEEEFLEIFVIRYQETVPEIRKAYKGGIAFAEFGDVGGIKDL